MVREVDIQAKDVKELMDLIAKNPTLPIVPMIDSEIVSDDGHNWWLGHWGKAEIDHMCVIGERIYFLSLDGEDLVDNYIDERYSDMRYATGEHGLQPGDLDKIGEDYLKSLPWEKAIVVWIQSR